MIHGTEKEIARCNYLMLCSTCHESIILTSLRMYGNSTVDNPTSPVYFKSHCVHVCVHRCVGACVCAQECGCTCVYM